jgi:hypothetical protein
MRLSRWEAIACCCRHVKSRLFFWRVLHHSFSNCGTVTCSCVTSSALLLFHGCHPLLGLLLSRSSSTRLTPSELPRPTHSIIPRTTRRPDRLLSLPDVGSHVVCSSLCLGVRCCLVFGTAQTFEVAGFGWPVVEKVSGSVYSRWVGAVVGENSLARHRVNTPTLTQRDLPVVACARSSTAVGHARTWELVLDGLVDARFGSWLRWSISFCRRSVEIDEHTAIASPMARTTVAVLAERSASLIVHGVSDLGCSRVKVLLRLLGDLVEVLALVFCRHLDGFGLLIDWLGR